MGLLLSPGGSTRLAIVDAWIAALADTEMQRRLALTRNKLVNGGGALKGADLKRMEDWLADAGVVVTSATGA